MVSHADGLRIFYKLIGKTGLFSTTDMMKMYDEFEYMISNTEYANHCCLNTSQIENFLRLQGTRLSYYLDSFIVWRNTQIGSEFWSNAKRTLYNNDY